jgi:hypothetical protein
MQQRVLGWNATITMDLDDWMGMMTKDENHDGDARE